MQLINYFKKRSLLLFSIAVSLFFLFSYKHFYQISYLNFSDSAKFADVARNLYQTGVLGKSFTFFDSKLSTNDVNELFSISGIPVLNPIVTYLSFKIFGVADNSVYMASMLFFILSSILIYLIGKKIGGRTVGFISSILFSSNPDMITYAINGASESLFIFEILLATYLVTLNKRNLILLTIPVLVAIYFTRPQSFIFIFCIFFYWLMIKVGIKKAVLGILAFAVVGLAVDVFILEPLSFKTQVYSITARGEQAILHYSPGSATSNPLRGGESIKLTYTEVAKKVFYNSYNFYKSIPQIVSPYIFALFLLSCFLWNRKKENNYLKIISLLSLFLSVLMASLTIPLIRYIHPALPFVFIFASDTLVTILKKFLVKNVLIAAFVIVSIFSLGQTFGIIFLDSRFVKDRYNFGKPPIYKEFSEIIKNNTDPNDLILTNLDTWGSWYGERKTVWYPIEPKQIVDINERKINFDAIFLTDYLIDDENYYMSESWRTIFNNPNNTEKWNCESCELISEQFYLFGVYDLPSDQNYHNQNGKAVLLKKLK